MNRESKIVLGEGLFSDDPVPVEIPFGDHTPTFFMIAMTQEEFAELEAQGATFKDGQSMKNTVATIKKIVKRCVLGWDGLMAGSKEIPFSDQNRDRLAAAPEVGPMLLAEAIKLAAYRQEQEEGN